MGDDGRMAFGSPTRALFIPHEDAEVWDTAIKEANEIYNGRMHNIFCDNCHSHVATALQRMNMRAYGVENWNMVKLAFLVFFKGKFLSKSAVYAQFGPFLFLVLVIVLSTVLTKR